MRINVSREFYNKKRFHLRGRVMMEGKYRVIIECDTLTEDAMVLLRTTDALVDGVPINIIDAASAETPTRVIHIGYDAFEVAKSLFLAYKMDIGDNRRDANQLFDARLQDYVKSCKLIVETKVVEGETRIDIQSFSPAPLTIEVILPRDMYVPVEWPSVPAVMPETSDIWRLLWTDVRDPSGHLSQYARLRSATLHTGLTITADVARVVTHTRYVNFSSEAWKATPVSVSFVVPTAIAVGRVWPDNVVFERLDGRKTRLTWNSVTDATEHLRVYRESGASELMIDGAAAWSVRLDIPIDAISQLPSGYTIESKGERNARLWWHGVKDLGPFVQAQYAELLMDVRGPFNIRMVVKGNPELPSGMVAKSVGDGCWELTWHMAADLGLVIDLVKKWRPIELSITPSILASGLHAGPFAVSFTVPDGQGEKWPVGYKCSKLPNGYQLFWSRVEELTGHLAAYTRLSGTALMITSAATPVWDICRTVPQSVVDQCPPGYTIESKGERNARLRWREVKDLAPFIVAHINGLQLIADVPGPFDVRNGHMRWNRVQSVELLIELVKNWGSDSLVITPSV